MLNLFYLQSTDLSPAVREVSFTELFPPCIRHLQQDSSHRVQADILTHIHPGHDHSRIRIELRHLIRKWVKSRSITTWMKFHARLPLSPTITLPTFFSTQGFDVDISVTLSLTMTKYIAPRLIRISIRIGRGEISPGPLRLPRLVVPTPRRPSSGPKEVVWKVLWR
jgi:hypothetical protein